MIKETVVIIRIVLQEFEDSISESSYIEGSIVNNKNQGKKKNLKTHWLKLIN